MPFPRTDARFHALVALGALAGAGCHAFHGTLPNRRDPEPDPMIGTIDLPFAAAFGSEPVEEAVEVPMSFAPERTALAGDELHTLELRDTTLASALLLVAEKAGASIYVDPGLDRRVDSSFRDVRLDDAVDLLLDRNGMRLVEDKSGIFFVEPNDGSREIVASFQVESANAVELESRVTALVASGTRVIVDPDRNLIVVRGREDEVQLVSDFLAVSDEPKQQVLLDVRIVEVKLDDRFELGISGSVSGSLDGDSLSLIQALSTGSTNIRMQFQSGNVDATLAALSEYTGLDLVTSPKILALDNTEALIEVLEEVPYVNTTATTSGTTGGVGSTVVEEVLFKETGMNMTVTPTIQEGGTLQIAIDSTYSEVISYFNDIPVVDSRHIRTAFQVKDQQTIVLGGLVQKRRAETDRGIPGLMHLPIIGRLFRSDSDNEEQRELLVFITPRIMREADVEKVTDYYDQHFRTQRRVLGMARQGRRTEGL